MWPRIIRRGDLYSSTGFESPSFIRLLHEVRVRIAVFGSISDSFLRDNRFSGLESKHSYFDMDDFCEVWYPSAISFFLCCLSLWISLSLRISLSLWISLCLWISHTWLSLFCSNSCSCFEYLCKFALISPRLQLYTHRHHIGSRTEKSVLPLIQKAIIQRRFLQRLRWILRPVHSDLHELPYSVELIILNCLVTSFPLCSYF